MCWCVCVCVCARACVCMCVCVCVRDRGDVAAGGPHLQVFEREDHWLCEEHPAGLLDGGGDHVAVDRQAPPTPRLARPRVKLHLHRGVLGGQEGAQVLVQDKHHLHRACAGHGQRRDNRRREERERDGSVNKGKIKGTAGKGR